MSRLRENMDEMYWSRGRDMMGPGSQEASSVSSGSAILESRRVDHQAGETPSVTRKTSSCLLKPVARCHRITGQRVCRHGVDHSMPLWRHPIFLCIRSRP